MTHTDPHHARRWLILAILGLAQLMVVLDATIVNIALPSAQKALQFSDANRQWIVTAYALAFGSLLLLGGRVGDLFGRKWVFVVGLIGFAVASAAGGAAQSFGMLVGARAAQGVFGAMLAPASLSLLTTTFTEPAERNKAFGIFGAIAGSGAAAGLLLGGVLTEYLSWRWCLYVNLAFAGVAVFGALSLLHNQPHPDKPRIDIPGTITASAGLFALVYGFSHAATTSWANATTLGFLAAGVVLIAVFVALQQRVANPLLPLRVVLDRDRGGSYLAMGLSAIAIFGVFLFLTYYLQQNLGFSPIQSGLAFLPMTFAIMISATTAQTKLVPRFGARPLVGLGMAAGAVGMMYLTGIGVHSSYASHVLPALMVMGVVFGLIFAPAMSAATLGVDPQDAGVASA
jgi:EmrB/QacA subfamily drug resistance transporter